MERKAAPGIGIPLHRFFFRVKFLQVNIEVDYAEYVFKVTAPNEVSFLVRDRYSKLLSFKNRILRDYGKIHEFKYLPQFPKKTLRSTLRMPFLEKRMKQLEKFF